MHAIESRSWDVSLICRYSPLHPGAFTWTGTVQRLALHAMNAVGLVHAMLLRVQVLLLPFKTLALSGGH